MNRIIEKKTLIKKIKRAQIPQNILKHYEIWKRIIELSGVEGLSFIKGLHDEALKGKWAGFRSSRLSIQWRVLYKMEEDIFEVFVIDINPHKY